MRQSCNVLHTLSSVNPLSAALGARVRCRSGGPFQTPLNSTDNKLDTLPPTTKQQQQSGGSTDQSWSISPARGTDTWIHDAAPTPPGSSRAAAQPPRTLSYQYPLFDHGMDWRQLADAAADVARFKAQQQAKAESGKQTRHSSSSSSSSSNSAGDRMRAVRRQMRQLRDLPGWLLYRYYNWRQDTGSDLLLVTGMSFLLLWSAAVIKHSYIDSLDAVPALEAASASASATATAGSVAAGQADLLTAPPIAADGLTMPGAAAGAAPDAGVSSSSSGLQAYMSSLWQDVYQVLVLSFGENFPSARATEPVEEVFSLLVALVGLAGFALALALVEQIVLETNLANVSRGSRVYESGHYLVLGWAVSQSDQEVIIKLVGQLCSSARAEGGTTIVVLTQREKLEMEDLFRRTIPVQARHGSRLVFRQGSPLLPSDLSNVAASYARSTVIVSDQSRTRDEADAQSLRCAILLDELDDYRGLRKGRALGHIVVETRTANAVPLLRYSCSKRVIALPTGQLNARRLAGMVKRPFVSWVTQRIWAFDSRCSVFMQPGKDHVGMMFRQVPFMYPDAIVLGVANTIRGHMKLNPAADYRIEPQDDLVLCRPTAVLASQYGHMQAQLSIPQLEQLGQQQLAQQQEAAAAEQGWLSKLGLPIQALLTQPERATTAAEAKAAAEAAGNDAGLAAVSVAPAIAAVSPVTAATAGSNSNSSNGSGDGSGARMPRHPSRGGIKTDSDSDSHDAATASTDVSGSGSSDWPAGSQSNPSSTFSIIESDSSSSSSSRRGSSPNEPKPTSVLTVASGSSSRSTNGGTDSSSSSNSSCSSACSTDSSSSSHRSTVDSTDSSSSSSSVGAGGEGSIMPDPVAGLKAGAPGSDSRQQVQTDERILSRPPQSSSLQVGQQPINAAAALAAADAAIPAGKGSSSSSSSIRRVLLRSGSSSRGLSCNSAILSDEEDAGEIAMPSTAVSSRAVTATEDDDLLEDDAILLEGDTAPQEVDAISLASSSSSIGGSVFDMWPEELPATIEQQQQQQQEPAAGEFFVSGWSSLGSTLDSMDAVPGFGSIPHSTTFDEAYSSNDSKDPTSSSSNRGASFGAASAAGRPSCGVDAAATAAAASNEVAADTGPYAQYYAQQQQQQQLYNGTANTAAAAAAAAAGGAAVRTVDGIKSPSPSPLAAAVPAEDTAPSWAAADRHPQHSSFNYVPREYLAADSSPEAVLVTGWSEPGFMGQLLWELDQGQSALPPGSEIVFVNPHLPDDTLGRVLKGKRLFNLKVSHVSLDPLRRDQLAVLPLHRFRAAIVLADEAWSGSETLEEGLDGQRKTIVASDMIDQPSVLRQDALMVMVQLNIRKLLEESGLPPINIICQKVANQGLTRFEDRRRLPLGISVNFNSMAAKLLTQVAVNPMNLAVLTHLGGCTELSIMDASKYCSRDEAISFWSVLSRAQAAGHVLMGYYVLPSHVDQPIESTINPQGLAVRSKKRVWNNGDGRLKFLVIRDRDRMT